MDRLPGTACNTDSRRTNRYGGDVILLPNMLLIGAANRDAGKTTFACGVIARNSLGGDIFGIKVTAIREKNGQCPRGGTGCGVCSSLTGDFCITEETSCDTDKDTARLLAAGCRRVFWLQVLHEHLGKGMTALLTRLPVGAPLVCESNSLSRVVKPGLFLMLQRDKGLKLKESAREAQPRADFNVTFDGTHFQPDWGELNFVNGSWRFSRS